MSTVCNEYLALSHVCSASTLSDRSQFKEYCYAKKFRRVVKTPISVSLVRFFQFSRLTKRQLSSIILLVLWFSFSVGSGEDVLWDLSFILYGYCKLCVFYCRMILRCGLLSKESLDRILFELGVWRCF